MESTRIPLDRLNWGAWRRVVLSVMRSEVGGRIKLLIAALQGLLLAINGLNVVNSYVGRDFMTAIEQRSMPGFLRMAALYIGVFAASTVAGVIYRFTEERLALVWRHWMTRAFVEGYLHYATYDRLREQGEIPNADQSHADDVRTTADNLASDINSLKSRLSALSGSFTGETATRWEDKFDEVSTQGNELMDAIGAIGDFLREAANTLEETDQSLASNLA